METNWLLLLLADSALPTGGFVASQGLESFVQLFYGSASRSAPRAETLQSVELFIRSNLRATSFSFLPFVVASCGLVQQLQQQQEQQQQEQQHLDLDQTETSLKHLETLESSEIPTQPNPLDQPKVSSHLNLLKQLDAAFDALAVTNNVSARASKAQGAAFLALLERAFANQLNPETAKLLKAFRKMVRAELSPGHLPVCFGVLCGVLGVSIDECQRLFLFHHVRSLVSASVRLNIVGPYEGQRQMLALGRVVDEILKEVHQHMQQVETDFAQERLARKEAILGNYEHERRMNGVFAIFDQLQETHSEFPEVELARRQAVQTGIFVEVVQGLHDRLYSRLFNS